MFGHIFGHTSHTILAFAEPRILVKTTMSYIVCISSVYLLQTKSEVTLAKASEGNSCSHKFACFTESTAALAAMLH